MKTFNLIDHRELHFDDATAPEWAVAYAYCEDHNMLSWLFSACHSKDMARAYGVLPFTRGKHSIACGDWAALLESQISA